MTNLPDSEDEAERLLDRVDALNEDSARKQSEATRLTEEVDGLIREAAATIRRVKTLLWGHSIH